LISIFWQERETGNWFLGSITDEEQRSLKIDFNFLEDNKEYEAIIYRDGQDAHWNDNPTSIDIEKSVINNSTTKTFTLAPGGGLAISLKLKDYGALDYTKMKD
jgi:hypothetical protein